MDPHKFPSAFEAENPIVGHELASPSIYIHDREGLEQHRPQIATPYAEFFEHAQDRLLQLSKDARNPEFAAWLDSVRTGTILLEAHDHSYFAGMTGIYSNNYIQFAYTSDYQQWQQNFPSYGVDVELLSEPIPFDLPEPLREVYRLGVIWMYGVPMSGYFYRPQAIQPALKEEYLGEYISDSLFLPLNYPMEELMVFYTDSGCWLMYDKSQRVYCGGVECGDFYRSSQNLDQVIGNIFRALRTKSSSLSIESFAPRE